MRRCLRSAARSRWEAPIRGAEAAAAGSTTAAGSAAAEADSTSGAPGPAAGAAGSTEAAAGAGAVARPGLVDHPGRTDRPRRIVRSNRSDRAVRSNRSGRAGRAGRAGAPDGVGALGEPVEQRRRDLGLPGGPRGGRVVTGGPEQARLVLHLHHDDGAGAIDLGQVPGQLGEGAAVGVEERGGEDGQDRRAGAGEGATTRPARAAEIGPGEALRVRPHPARRVGGGRVLEGAEPQEGQGQAALAGHVDERVDAGEVVAPLHRLHQVPADGGGDGVAAHRHDPVEGGAGPVQVRARGVVELSPQQEPGSASEQDVAVSGRGHGDLSSDRAVGTVERADGSAG